MQDSFNMLKVNQEKAKNVKTVSDLVKDMVYCRFELTTLIIIMDDFKTRWNLQTSFVLNKINIGKYTSLCLWIVMTRGRHVTIKIAGVTAAGGEWGLIWAHLIWWLTSCLYLGMMHALSTNQGKMFMFNVTLREKKQFSWYTIFTIAGW